LQLRNPPYRPARSSCWAAAWTKITAFAWRAAGPSARCVPAEAPLRGSGCRPCRTTARPQT